MAVLLIAGGAWHILVSPFQWVKRVFLFSGDGILSYSLFGIALAGFAASYYCGFNSLAYPEEFYGPTLELQSSLLPRYFEAQPTLVEGYTSRIWLANTHFYLAFFFLQGGLWHFQRAMGFDIGSLVESWQQNLALASDNPTLTYQRSGLSQSQSTSVLQYGLPQAAPQFWLKQEQPFADYFYRPSQGIEPPSLTTINGIEKALYQTTYHFQKETFYQPSKQVDNETLFGYGSKSLKELYEQPKTLAKISAYSKPIATVFYEPKRSSNGVHSSNVESAAV